MRIKLPIICVLLISSSLVRPIDWRHKSDREKVVIVAGVSAAASCGAYLLYKLFTFEPSNERVLMKAQQLYDRLNSTYGSVELVSKGDALLHYTEQDLALVTFHRDIGLLPSVSADLQILQRERDIVRARVHRDAYKNDPVIADMRHLLQDMKDLEATLLLLKRFWEEHGIFFDLYRCIKTLAERYEEARVDVYDADLVRRAIMAASVNTHQAYPCLCFAETLKRDIDGLKYRMDHAGRYEVLHGKAERLYESLVGLLGTVANLPEYREELRLQKQHQLEQERVNAMHEKADAERLKAEAMAQQAAAEREKAQAMHHQAMATMAKPTPQSAQVTVNVHS